MKTPFEQLAEKMRHEKMTTHEKDTMRTQLVSFIQKNPAIDEMVGQQTGFFYFLTRKTSPIFALLLIVFLGIGTTSAAEGALPGEVLYPVKIHVNEKVRTLFTVGAKADATWEVKRAERRLEETEKLVAKGKLTAKLETELKADFAAHAEAVHKYVAVLELQQKLEDAAQISVAFESSLKAHEAVAVVLEVKPTVIAAVVENRENLEEKLLAKPIKETPKIKFEATATEPMMIDTEDSGDDDDGDDDAADEDMDMIDTTDLKDGLENQAPNAAFMPLPPANTGAQVTLNAKEKVVATERMLKETTELLAKYRAQLEAKIFVEAELKLKKATGLVTEAQLNLETNVTGNTDIVVKICNEAEKIMVEVQALIKANVKIEVKAPDALRPPDDLAPVNKGQ